ncbi:helix-turn-helix transcriptional regulator [Achromobacter seleniivolatilans]|uniref:Helix-turn-helix transcriptional regulator n=1 Tax=Achromobacter seleniivolatilans TaxID=3047478 RepID=A0ABY9M4Q9_9BURK|nr:helix-turn-helix transcriptional regulator [Achromobacter sp. R39]WMD20792.1 helix-turn-helix transcriptional regulator [Achromobacter sp. R39]
MSFLKSIMQFTFSQPVRRPPSTLVSPQPMRQVEVLTSTKSHCVTSSNLSLPFAVLDLLVTRHCSAVRAWRTHRGLAMASLQERTNMHSPTLSALDRGDVELCEWTVEILAKALRVDPSLLLKAEMLSVKTREGSAWPLTTLERK